MFNFLTSNCVMYVLFIFFNKSFFNSIYQSFYKIRLSISDGEKKHKIC